MVLKGGLDMSHIRHEDFEAILLIIRNELLDIIEFEEVRSIESNFDTKGMMFRRRGNRISDGTIIAGEDNALIAIDISKADGEVISFIIKDKEDSVGINNVILWLRDNYR